MLNSLININSEKETEYPISFKHKNICLRCGKENCLELFDIYNNKQIQDIHAYKEIICKNCKTKFTIQWEADETGEMKPSAVGNEVKINFIKENINGR